MGPVTNNITKRPIPVEEAGFESEVGGCGVEKYEIEDGYSLVIDFTLGELKIYEE